MDQSINIVIDNNIKLFCTYAEKHKENNLLILLNIFGVEFILSDFPYIEYEFFVIILVSGEDFKVFIKEASGDA